MIIVYIILRLVPENEYSFDSLSKWLTIFALVFVLATFTLLVMRIAKLFRQRVDSSKKADIPDVDSDKGEKTQNDEPPPFNGFICWDDVNGGAWAYESNDGALSYNKIVWVDTETGTGEWQSPEQYKKHLESQWKFEEKNEPNKNSIS